ncbi:O-antigen polymerase [Aliarcobacter cryaerophilus]|uniref:O-antigen polymerase n=2 Tax=Arcobacteraceae TaxID=2808963 RepID=A0AA96IIS3_9BACT|nr:O-antigen polymerase [Arcobacter sp. AZ-2023]
MIVNKKVFYPLFYLIFIWSSFIIVRNSFIIKWGSIDLVTILFLLIVFIITILFYFIFLFILVNKSKNIRRDEILIINIKKIKFIYNYLLFFSIIYILCVFVRFFLELIQHNIAFSLSSFVELREKTMEGSEFSQSTIGILSTMFSGFHIILFIFIMWANKHLKSREIKIAQFVFFIGTSTFLFGGGRNAIFISVLIVLLSIYFINFAGLRRIKINKFKFFISIFFIAIIFLYIFVARDEYLGITMIDRINLNEFNYNIKFNNIMVDLLQSNSNIIKYGSYFIMYMTFYLTHSLTFLDLGFITDLPKHAYYFGAMEFYPIVLFFNKFGFDFISIDTIREEWIFSGNYTTLFLPLYYDFGIMGTFLMIVFLIFLFVYNLLKFLNNKNLISLILLIIISLVFILSPIYSFFSLGVFLPILFAFTNLFVIMKLLDYRNSKLKELK